MKYFDMIELSVSETAKKNKIDNKPGAAEEINLRSLVKLVLDPLREAWGSPLKLTCAYRSKELNKKVGGHPNSHHTYGCAADIICIQKDQDRMMKLLIANPHVDLCQNYPDRNFVHVNIARPGEKTRRLSMTQWKDKKAVAYTK